MGHHLRTLIVLGLLVTALPPTASSTVGPFELQTPSNGGWCTPTCTFKWSSPASAVKAEFYVDGTLTGATEWQLGFGLPAQYTVLPQEALTAGTHYWSVRAYDTGGTFRDSTSTWTVRIDPDAPAPFALVAPADAGWGSQEPDIEFRWAASADAASGVASYQLFVDGSPADIVPYSQTSIRASNAPIALPRLTAGEHSWYVVATDAAGNTRAATSIRTIRIDNTPPLLSGANGFEPPCQNVAFTRPPHLQWSSATDAESGVAAYRVAFGRRLGLPLGSGAVDLERPFRSTYQVDLSLPNKPVKLQLNATLDPGLGLSHLTVQVRAGTAYGVTKLNLGTQGFNSETLDLSSFSGRIITLSLNCSQHCDITYYLYALDAYDTGLATTFDFPSDLVLSDGTYNWQILPIDGAGNVGPAALCAFDIDTVAPSAPRLTTPEDDVVASVGTPTLCWTGPSDRALGGFKLYIDGIENRSNIPAFSNCSTPLVPLTEGIHEWTVAAVDQAGNVGETAPPRTIIYGTNITSPSATARPTDTPIPPSTATPSGTFTPSSTSTVTPSMSPTSTTMATTTPTEVPTATATASITYTASPTVAPTNSRTMTDTPSVTPTRSTTPTPTPSPSPSATTTPRPCTGDCDQDGTVAVDELITGVRIALGATALVECPAVDCNGNGRVSVECLVQAVAAALNGCPS